jgi:hypothetical protein
MADRKSSDPGFHDVLNTKWPISYIDGHWLALSVITAW